MSIYFSTYIYILLFFMVSERVADFGPNLTDQAVYLDWNWKEKMTTPTQFVCAMVQLIGKSPAPPRFTLKGLREGVGNWNKKINI